MDTAKAVDGVESGGKKANGRAAEALYIGRVETKSGGLNVRRTPGGEVMGMLGRGEAVTVLGEAGEWLTIAYGEGVGYAAKAYIQFAKSAQEAARIVIEDEAGNVFIPQGGYTARLATGPID